MYALARRQQAPTAVEYAVRAQLTKHGPVNLVLAKNTLLQIYAVRSKLKPGDDHKNRVARLDLIAEFPLFGNIKGLAVAKRPNAPDMLVVGLAEAKITVLEWDARVHNLRIISMHFYENDQDIKGGHTQFVVPNILEVEYESRCAIYLVYDRALVVLPFEETDISDTNSSSSTKSDTIKSRSYVIRLPNLGIYSVRDVKFLHGYYDPTIMILYEKSGTWAGQLNKRTHTVSAVIVSLNISARKETVVWAVDRLPHDAYQIVPLPDAVGGGALILSVNEILSVNQSSQYRLSLNYFGDTYNTDVATTTEYTSTPLALEAARWTFISDNALLMSLHHGDLHVVTIISDGRSVTHLDIQRVGTSVPAACICTLTNKLVFLGSRVGDSVLIMYREKVEGDQRSAKRRRGRKREVSETMEINTELTDADIIDPRDMDDDVRDLVELMLQSGNYMSKDSQVIRYELSVVDTLETVAPIISTIIQPSFDRGSKDLNYEHFANTKRKQMELLCCTGANKHGSLVIMQHSIRPIQIMSLDVPSCVGIWAVNLQSSSSSTYHNHIVISRTDRTMILEAGESLREITHRARFNTDRPTLNIGTVCKQARMVQVHFYGLTLLDGVSVVDKVRLSEGMHVVWSSICDPYILLLLNDGSLALYEAVSEDKLQPVEITLPPESSPITACCLFVDKSNTLGFNQLKSSASKSDEQQSEDNTADSMMEDEDELTAMMKADPEEKLLYKTVMRNERLPEGDDHETLDPELLIHPIYCAITRLDGTFEVYRLPDFSMAFYSDGLGIGAHLLPHIPRPDPITKTPCVVEMDFVDLGGPLAMPYLVAILDNGDVLIYKSFYIGKDHVGNTLPIGFRRLDHGLLTRHLHPPDMGWAATSAVNGYGERDDYEDDDDDYPSSSSRKRRRDSSSEPRSKRRKSPERQSSRSRSSRPLIPSTQYPPLGQTSQDEEEAITRIVTVKKERTYWRRIVPFDNIAGRRGAFVCGMRPFWIFAERGGVQCFYMDADRTVHTFTPFHNVNCENGFIYYTAANKLKISQLHPALILEANLPMLKIPLRATPHSVVFDAENEVLAVMVSVKVKDMVRYLKPAGDDRKDKEREQEMLERGEDPENIVYNEADVHPRMPVIYDRRYELRIISPETWEQSDTLKLKDEEIGRVATITLKTQEKEDGPDKILPFLVVAASLVRSEDAAPKSRILLYEFFKESVEGQRPHAKLNFLCDREEKGPITALSQVGNLLVACVGSKINMYQLLVKREIIPVAFFDAQLLVVGLSIIKNFVLVSDIYKSVYFLRWKEHAKNLFLLGKDYDKMEVYSADYLVDNEKLTIVAADESQHIHMYTYDPKQIQSLKGQKLLCIGNYHVGTRVSSLMRTKLNKLNYAVMGNQPTRVGLIYGGVDGSVGYIIPISSEKFKRLGKLEMRLVSILEHAAGLNPKAFRLWRPRYRVLQNHQRRVIDGDLISKFAFLDRQQQDELASQLDATTDEIMDWLIELDLMTRFF